MFGSRGGGSAAPITRKDTSLLEDPRLCYSVLLGRWCWFFQLVHRAPVTVGWSDMNEAARSPFSWVLTSLLQVMVEAATHLRGLGNLAWLRCIAQSRICIHELPWQEMLSKHASKVGVLRTTEWRRLFGNYSKGFQWVKDTVCPVTWKSARSASHMQDFACTGHGKCRWRCLFDRRTDQGGLQQPLIRFTTTCTV